MAGTPRVVVKRPDKLLGGSSSSSSKKGSSGGNSLIGGFKGGGRSPILANSLGSGKVLGASLLLFVLAQVPKLIIS